MSASEFTHLHVHSQFSLLAATPSVAALAERAAADGLQRLALTDSNALYGMVAFARACNKVGVLPIAGMALTVALPAADGSTVPDVVVLLAQKPSGYVSLCRLSSAVQASLQRDRLLQEGIAWETLAGSHAGLVCLCGGRRSELDRTVRAGRFERASTWLARYAGLFDGDCRLGIELHAPADSALAKTQVELASRFGVRAVAVEPVYCLQPDERPLLRVLSAIERNCRIEDVKENWMGAADAVVHWLSPAEIAERFAAFPDAVVAAGELAAQCEPFHIDSRPVFPVLPLAAGESVDAALARTARSGLAQRYGNDEPAAQRLEGELEAIAGHGFAPFFLIVADIVAYARTQNIPVSTRGSVANSLAAYCLGITTVDPIANDLLFERFLNPAHSGLPDIDLDFCSRRRDEVLEYVRRTYGADHVALVATISTLRLRSAVRETSKVFGFDDAAIERLIRLTPDSWHPDPRRRVKSDLDSVLPKLSNEREREAIRFAFALVGQPDHLSVHPGGLVITPGPLTDHTPVQLAPKGFLITQYDHGDVEAIGLPKLDLLGIRALTVLADAVELVRQYDAPEFTLDRIPLDDPATAALLQRGETVAVFQCESTGAQRTLRQLKTHSVPDLAVANAFYKPGPATGGMAMHFVRRYRGEETVVYLHPALEPILSRTSGVLLFQEQILRIAREVAGLSWEEADHLRKGMSKFQGQEMEAIRERFLAGCRRTPPDGPGFDHTQAQTLWEQVKAFAGYGFNQGHATAYADVSYRSAYLKAHWPAAFLCARLADWGGYYHPAVYIAEARRLGIAVRPPHVNHSTERFTLEFEPSGVERNPVLWMGLGQVRDLRQASLEQIIEARQHNSFGNIGDLVRRTALQTKELTNLIQCGALDGFGPSRAAMLAEQVHLERGGLGQLSFDFVTQAAELEVAEERLAWEERVLGIPVSVHPLDLCTIPRGAIAIVDLHNASRTTGKSIQVAGARLPGWTGGPGFLADGRSYLLAIGPKALRAPAAWQPVVVTGRWTFDEWGGGAFHFERWDEL